jgi:outer membrane lipase/esterase
MMKATDARRQATGSDAQQDTPRQRLVRRFALAASATCAALIVAACGGGNDGSGYGKLIVFGDSLSDVGSYATPGLRAGFAGGAGKYTVNSATAANTAIWVDLLADQLGVTRPCAAQTGLMASGPLAGLAAAVTNNASCYGFAQGGARVTNPVGPGNAALLQAGDSGGALGQLTSPVTSQVSRYLAANSDRVSGSDLVTVLAGANDLFMNLAAMNAAIAAGTAQATAVNNALTAMATAGGELAAIVRNQLVAKGAARVVVMTVPDVSTTPFGRSLGASLAPVLQNMSIAFNNQLTGNLNGVQGVLVVDGYALTQAMATNPSSYGFSNSTVPACDARATLGSLSCSSATTPAGVDVSAYQYADGVHPAPLAHRVFSDFVSERLRAAGWL